MNQFWVEHLDRLRDSVLAQTRRVRSGSTHPTIKGSSIEVIVRRVLKQYLPAKFQVGTGQVANNRQELSPQIDAIIYDGSTFPHLAVNEDSSVVICCEPLFAAVECKSQWDSGDVARHYRRFVEVVSGRHSLFEHPRTAPGYFVLAIDKMSSILMPLEDENRFVGVYSLEGNRGWSSPFGESEFSEQDGNALALFLQNIMYDCMRKNVAELGSLEWTYEAVQSYFGWGYDK